MYLLFVNMPEEEELAAAQAAIAEAGKGQVHMLGTVLVDTDGSEVCIIRTEPIS